MTEQLISDVGCGCGTKCCDRHLETEPAPANDTCCSPTEEDTASCGCGTSDQVVEQAAPARKQLDIEFLYLDLSICTRCQGTEAVLQEAIAEVAGVLEATGTAVTVNNIHVQSEEQAQALGFQTSPTIRLNGQDIQLDYQESHCGSCGSLCGDDVACRE